MSEEGTGVENVERLGTVDLRLQCLVEGADDALCRRCDHADYLALFHQARAVSCLWFALDSTAHHAALEALCEAYIAADADALGLERLVHASTDGAPRSLC